MVRFLIRIAVFLGLAALALGLAALLVPGFHLHWAGFVVAILVFAIVQAVVEWLVERIFHRSAPSVAGVAGLISTALALWIASIVGDGLSFDGIGAWILATVVVWLVTALIGWLAAKYLLPRVAPGKPAKGR
ncbi:phage holin family protein [Agromyces sp. MMS24-JH15]|uniref:phage holin family protein n=1 Tax=Agromyces sp. MMS24-JH15 TaxID=3243765 RepID=UPI00374829E9